MTPKEELKTLIAQMSEEQLQQFLKDAAPILAEAERGSNRDA